MILFRCYFEAVASPFSILSSIKTLFFNTSSLITLSSSSRPCAMFQMTIRGALRDLVQFVQFQKLAKPPWKSVFSQSVMGVSHVF